MKKLRHAKYVIRTAAIIGVLTLAACAPGAGGARLWIDSPRDGVVVPLGGVVVDSTIGEGGVEVVDLYANDLLVRSDLNPDPGARLTTIRQIWDPPAEGDYRLYIVGRAGEEEIGRSVGVNVRVGFVDDARTCAPDELTAPVAPFSPGIGAIVEPGSARLSWAYSEECDPGGFRIELSLEGDFATHTIAGGGTLPAHSWSPADPLEPGTRYYWHVAPMTLTTVGPYSPTRWFFTGPVCAREALARPDLLSPANDAVIESLTPTLSYSSDNRGACTPEAFQIDLATDPDFTDGSPWFQTTIPTWSVVPAEPLLDCTQYYWRVAPMISGEPGPFSETFTFFTNGGGSCVTIDEPTPIPTVVIPGGIFNQNANCRSGPGTVYPVLRTFLAGEQVDLQGQSAFTPKWWWAQIPGTGQRCWASDTTLDLIGPVMDLPVIAAPPTPTPAISTPPPPGNLAISNQVCTSETYSVTLSWFDAAGNEDGYRVYRDGALIATLGAGSNSHTDFPPGSGPYTYGVEAFNAAGASVRLTVQEAGCVY